MSWFEQLVSGTRGRIVGLLRRSRGSIGDLAQVLGISGNAVRGHVAALQRDGLVREAGMAPSTGGKPAQLYDITSEAEELFPKAYALALAELIRGLDRRDGHERTRELLREVGALTVPEEGATVQPLERRVEYAARLLRGLGGDVVVEGADGSWSIRGFGCPLSSVVKDQPDACALAQGVVEAATGGTVTECCDRGERPRCNFVITSGPPR